MDAYGNDELKIQKANVIDQQTDIILRVTFGSCLIEQTRVLVINET